MENFRVVIQFDRSAERELADRAQRWTPTGPPLQLSPLERSVHFLRGVGSRASMTLPNFYLFLGAGANRDEPCLLEGYPGVVLQHTLEHSSMNEVTLSCRKVFDHHIKGLTGASFGRTSDAGLAEVAKYWADKSGRPYEDALTALSLLRLFFRDCSRTDEVLLRADAPLKRRIGLLKQHADRSAAHLSLDGYEFCVLDCVHFMAALVMIGEIVRSFDSPNKPADYYDTLDQAALSSASQLFPSMPSLRMFAHMQIELQARLCWKWGIEDGMQMLLYQLPYAIGWW